MGVRDPRANGLRLLSVFAVLVSAGCESDLWNVEPQPERAVGDIPGVVPRSLPGGDVPDVGKHDPETQVYESLPSRDDLLADLKSGECVAHYARAWTDKFTPLRFTVDWSEGAPSPRTRLAAAVALVRRGEETVLRTLCRFPATEWHADFLDKLLREKLEGPPFKHDEEGWLKVRDEWKRPETASADIAPGAWPDLRSGTGSGRIAASAASRCSWTLVHNPETGALSLIRRCPPITVTGCQDPDLDWDESTGTCVPRNGSTTVPPPPPPPPNPPGGGVGNPPPTTAEVTLECGSGARGSEVSCRLVKQDTTAALSDIMWTFEPDGGRPPATREGGESWGGTAVVGGVMRVTLSVNGTSKTLPGTVSVSARDWSWSATVTSARGLPKSGCDWQPSHLGLTSGKNCGDLFDHSGFTVAAGGGPWSGLHFISATTAVVSVHWDIHPDFRANGTRHRVGSGELRSLCRKNLVDDQRVNIHRANTACAASTPQAAQFKSLMSLTEAHEGEHVKAALAAARDPANDLHKSWESMIDTSSDTLTARAKARASSRPQIRKVLRSLMMCGGRGCRFGLDGRASGAV